MQNMHRISLNTDKELTLTLEKLIHRIATDEDFADKFHTDPEQTLSALDFELEPAEREGFLRMVQARNKAQEAAHTQGEEWYRAPSPDTTAGIDTHSHTEGEEWYRAPSPDTTAGIDIHSHTEGEEWYRAPAPDSMASS